MVSRKGFTRWGTTYLWLVIAAGFMVVAFSLRGDVCRPAWPPVVHLGGPHAD